MNGVPRWLAGSGFVAADDDGAWELLSGRDLAALDEIVRSVAAVLDGPDPWGAADVPDVALTDGQRRDLER